MSEKSLQQEKIRARVLVSGTVQGVGYRFSTLNEAREVGISGWVRNLADGRVEAVFEGNRGDVEAMIRWCHEGSLAARVTDVAVKYEPPEGMQGFEIKK